jgi:hypothetical protein
VETLIIHLVIHQSDWSSGLRDSSVVPYCSFLHSLSLRVTDLCRRLTSAFRGVFLVTCHCFRSRFSGVFHPPCLLVSKRVGPHVGDAWE